MSNWSKVIPDISIPTGKLRLFRQTTIEGNVKLVSPATITHVTAAAARCVADAVKKARRTLELATENSQSLTSLDTYVSQINTRTNERELKTRFDTLIFANSFTGLKSEKKKSLLRRFFGEKTNDILNTMNDGVGSVRRKFSLGMVFRSCLMSTIVGLNLQLQSLVLGLDDYGNYGDSITDWSGWKTEAAAPGIDLSRHSFASVLMKAVNAIGDGYLRCNVRYLLRAEETSEHLYVPGMVFRNSDFFTLTYLHESSHLFTGIGDHYYFLKPWDGNPLNKRIICGIDNPDKEFAASRTPTSERSVVNADSYAWFLFMLGGM